LAVVSRRFTITHDQGLLCVPSSLSQHHAHEERMRVGREKGSSRNKERETIQKEPETSVERFFWGARKEKEKKQAHAGPRTGKNCVLE